MKLKVGVVGATGMVGEEFLRLIEERNFPIAELRLFASDKSIGQNRAVADRVWTVQGLTANAFDGLDLVFFSSGDEISKEWAPKAVAAGAFAIDNSAAFRLTEGVPLVVPEVNGHDLPAKEWPSIVANPNCSTIQLVVALKPLSERFGIRQVRVATYQAVSGAGRAAQQELTHQTRKILQQTETPQAVPSPEAFEGLEKPENFPHTIAFNCIPQVGGFGDDGFCSEERKIRLETRKILNLPHLHISAWTIRIPALNAHSEAAWVTLDKAVDRKEILDSLTSQPGLKVSQEGYPHALMASGTDPVYVGRIHQDPDDPKTWLMWIVADNLRKGAALNGIQIAERIFLERSH